jgi:hypothetical protein
MHRHRPSCLIVVSLITTQLLGPAVLWAADQRGVRIEATRRVVVSALSGDQLTMQNGGGTKTLQFREGVAAGDRLTTGDRTMAEVLLGTRAVVTVGQGTSVQFTTVTPEQTTIQVSKGTVRVAAAASALGEQGLVTVQTPTGQVQTRGGIVRVLVDAPVRSAEQTPTGEARPYLASYAPTTLLAAVNTRGDVIQVEEGTAEILGAGPGAKAVTVQAGQAVGVQAGQAGPIAGITTQDSLKSGVVATAGHRSTPKEGMDNLVALQVDQATQLGKALTGAAETGEGQTSSGDQSKNAINGATGGVTLNSSLVNTLFGIGSATDPSRSISQERTGSGYAGDSNDSPLRLDIGGSVRPRSHYINGMATPSTTFRKGILLTFTSQTPYETVNCGLSDCSGLATANLGDPDNGPPQLVGIRTGSKVQSVVSAVSSTRASGELVLIEGRSLASSPHQGVPQPQWLMIRGGSNHPQLEVSGAYGPKNVFTQEFPFATEFLNENSKVVVEAGSTSAVACGGGSVCNYRGGSLGGFSERIDGVFYNFEASPDVTAISNQGDGVSYVNAAITGSRSQRLGGGVSLDHGTQTTIGSTTATNNYFSTIGTSDAKFSGSLLAVINGPDSSASLTMEDRLLGVYDGSRISSEAGNKALLSVLDAKLTGPGESIPLIALEAGFKEDGVTPGAAPEVTVTSAVVTRSTIPLDGALLEASSPLFALTNAKMTTTSHFADLAGNATASMRLGDVLVALNASQLLIQNGHLLNLNAANATVNGYLFSLTGGSALTLNNGLLFSLNNGSSLALNANAFGVFGSGANTLSITNNLCVGGAACGLLVNATNTPFLLNGTPIKVAGVSQNVVLPNSFNVFAVAQNAPAPTVTLSANAALFKVDGTSTLTINATKVR